MPTKIEEKLQEQTAATAFQLVWTAVKGIGASIVEQEAIQKGMKAYANNFLERFGQVKILGMAEAVPLREIYTAAQVISPNVLSRFRSTIQLQEIISPRQIHARRFSDLELEEALFEQDRRGLSWINHDEPRRPCLDLANKERFLNVLGAPGAGKTTFLRRLGLEALLPRRSWNNSIRTSLGLKAGLDDSEFSHYTHDCIPIIIELQRFKTEDVDLLKLIRSELASCGLPESEKLVETLLSDGHCLLLLDGLDEVPRDKLDMAISHIHDFISRNNRNRFVMSCRAAFYRDYFPRFKDVILAEFDSAQIENFVRNWFHSERDRQAGIADGFLGLLNSPAHFAAKELASTPLLLTFLCLTYDDRLSLPANRSTLYGKALDILLERWSASKRVHNEPIYRELTAELEVQMLSEIAVHGFRENKYFFSKRELSTLIGVFLRNELNAPKHLDTSTILEAIEVQQGLLMRRAQDAYSFSHLTLQEYLTAAWHTSNNQLDSLVQEHMMDARWREVIILAAGLVGKADNLLRKMIATISNLIPPREHELALLIQWANDAVPPSDDPIKDAAARTLALALASGRSYAADSALNLAGELDSDKVFEGVNQIIRRYAQVGGSLLDSAHGQRFTDYTNSRLSLKRYIASAALPLATSLHASPLFRGTWDNTITELNHIKDSAVQISSVEALQRVLHRAHELPLDSMQLPPKLRFLKKSSRRLLDEYMRACLLLVSCKSAATSVSRVTWQSICLRIAAPVKSA
ncbi:NACHT domain-containing protein [Stigmatella hybrida]|uniref:NACHT domain-containing protein n=1 Tax=Stigmatella hybrida TaxID=394097 RepID=UPI001CDACFC4|nr:hypothetical protein [Stigmatella hybrida]